MEFSNRSKGLLLSLIPDYTAAILFNSRKKREEEDLESIISQDPRFDSLTLSSQQYRRVLYLNHFIFPYFWKKLRERYPILSIEYPPLLYTSSISASLFCISKKGKLKTEYFELFVMFEIIGRIYDKINDVAFAFNNLSSNIPSNSSSHIKSEAMTILITKGYSFFHSSNIQAHFYICFILTLCFYYFRLAFQF